MLAQHGRCLPSSLRRSSSNHGPIPLARPAPVRLLRAVRPAAAGNGNGSNGNGATNGASANGAASNGADPLRAEHALPLSPPLAEQSPPSSLDLAFESAEATAPTIKTTGLRRAPLSGGVKTATDRYDLPAPSVAVRNLVEQAQFAHLCTVMSHMHHRRAGYPFGTLVDFAVDGAGMPVFCLSPLAIHARNIIEDPRCCLVVQMPGWTGLANARVTIFGDIYQLPSDMQDAARDIFSAKQASERKERWVLGNFMFFRMHRIVDIYFVGGFGTVQWIDVAEYLRSVPDAIATRAPQRTLQVLNETFADELKEHLLPHVPIDDAAFISIDASGADVRVRHGHDSSVERIGFDTRVTDLEGAIGAVRAVLAKGKGSINGSGKRRGAAAAPAGMLRS